MSNQTEWQKWCEETAPVMAAAGRGEFVQVQGRDEEWLDRVIEDGFCYGLKYRIKPRTIRIGEYDVPEPMREAPEMGEECWFPIVHNNSCRVFIWEGTEVHMEMLDSGFIHSTKEAADLHAKALRSLTAKKD